MLSQFLQSVGSSAAYPLAALVMFFAFFLGVVVWTLKADKRYIEEMENLPLSSSTSAKGAER